jgi:hypothetical protein
MKKIKLLLLLLVSTSVFAEWTEIARPSSNRYTVYIDYPSIRKIENSNIVSLWMLTDWKTIRDVSGDKYLSNQQHIKVDCKQEIMWLLDFTWYSKNMGLGNIVWTQSNLNEKATAVAPNTVDSILFNIVCAK